MKDYYEILGVSPSSPSAEIRRVYRKLALQYHPDKNHAPEAQQIFIEINEAYEILGSEENRRWYDYKFQNTHTVNEEAIDISVPANRDPAYRNRPHVPPPMSAAKQRIELIKKCLPYVSWATWAGIALMFIFIIDYSLPMWHAVETVTDCYVVHTRRGESTSAIIKTTGLHTVRFYEGSCFNYGEIVDLRYTPILRSVFRISSRDNAEKIIETRGVYGNIIFVPMMFFLGSVIGYFVRKNIETSFNVNIINIILFPIVLYFILRG